MRKSFTAEFKGKVALEAFKEEKTISLDEFRIRSAFEPDKQMEAGTGKESIKYIWESSSRQKRTSAEDNRQSAPYNRGN